jgi:hypothetical protein
MNKTERFECPFCFADHTKEVWAQESEDIESFFCDCGAVWFGGMPDVE